MFCQRDAAAVICMSSKKVPVFGPEKVRLFGPIVTLVASNCASIRAVATLLPLCCMCKAFVHSSLDYSAVTIKIAIKCTVLTCNECTAKLSRNM